MKEMPQSYIEMIESERQKCSLCHTKVNCHGSINYKFLFYLLILGNLTNPINAFGGASFNDAGQNIGPTPALRLDKQDLTTVLLVRNGANEQQNHGRFINVRPEVGLLTSTARTFIQEGITTEYTTQVVGTTLDNGRMYAHLLKRSSRILYDPLQTVTASPVTGSSDQLSYRKSLDHNLPQSHNDLFNADKPDWRAIDDSIFLQRYNFISNTDLVKDFNENNNKHDHDRSESSSSIEMKRIPSSKDFNDENYSKNDPKKLSDHFEYKIMPEKVLPEANLPTFTIKHHYEPSGYAYKNYTNLLNGAEIRNFDRQPKYIYQSGGETLHASPHKPKNINNMNLLAQSHLSTVTYYGFADFTTIVGDSVIVFSPSTTDAAIFTQNANVTSIKGEATIHDKTIFTTKTYTDLKTTKTTTTLADIPINVYSKYNVSNNDNDHDHDDDHDDDDDDDDTKLMFNGSRATSRLDTSQEISTYEILSTIATDPLLTESLETPITSSSMELSTKDAAAVEVTSDIEMLVANDANVTTIGGATTIFFESDPFKNFIETTIPITTTSQTEMEIQTRMVYLDESDSSNGQAGEGAGEGAKTEMDTATEMQKELETEQETEQEMEPDTVTEPEPEMEENYDSPETGTEVDITTIKNDAPMEMLEEIGTITTTTTSMIISLNQNEVQDAPSSSSASSASSSASSSSVIIKEIDQNDLDVDTKCSKTSQVFLTNSPKTVTTTATSTRFIIEDQITKTLTDYHLNYIQTFDIGETTKYYCIQTVAIGNDQLNLPMDQQQTLNDDHNDHDGNDDDHSNENPQEKDSIDSVEIETIENRDSNTISMMQLIPSQLNDNNDDDINNNLATPILMSSTLNATISLDDGGEGMLDREERPLIEKNYEDTVNDNDNNDNNDDDDDDIELFYKTFYTTYTYLTTYFHEETTSVSSHTEVITNIVTSTVTHDELGRSKILNEIIAPTTSSSQYIIDRTRHFTVPNDIKMYLNKHKEEEEDLEPLLGMDNTNAMNTEILNVKNHHCSVLNDKTYYTTYTYYTTIFADDKTETLSRTEVHTNFIKPSRAVYGMDERSACLACNDDNDYILNAVNGSDQYECVFQNKSQKISAESTVNSERGGIINGEADQISSESNPDDEILTSAMVLLKTSYTTYTYYTTIYSGDQMNVISRLETITNTHTETLPSIMKTQTLEDTTLPITYYTTFTYWTKLAKDGHITTLSREETVSNIVIPSNADYNLTQNVNDFPIMMTAQQNFDATNANALDKIYSTTLLLTNKYEEATTLSDVLNGFDNDPIPTTYYTTYTYYTTSYEADNTIINSRLETITNIVTPSIGMSSSSVSISTPATMTTMTTMPQVHGNHTDNPKRTEAIFYDLKKIIDGDGISTLYITTQIEPTWNENGEYSELTTATTSLHVNETKKHLVSSSLNGSDSDTQKQKVYKTGLVRLIDGTRIGNSTTTLYKSKVIGTIIDQRYAQIIESTSSFLFKQNTNDPDDLISSTATFDNAFITNTEMVSPLPPVTPPQNSTERVLDANRNESSNNNKNKNNNEKGERENIYEIEVEEEDDVQANPKSAFTPVVRPFAKNNRGQFFHKKVQLAPSSATIITRSDFTPTITATPALKSVNRYTSSRRGSSILTSSTSGYNGATRRFGRGPLRSQLSTASSRNRLNNITSQQPARFTSSLGFRRLNGLNIKPTYLKSSTYTSGVANYNSRFGRVRNTIINTNIDEANSDDDLPNQDGDEANDNVDQQQNNSLLRNRKIPPINRSNRISSNPKPFNYNIGGKARNNPLKARTTTTTTTSSPSITRTTLARPRTFQRPIIPAQRDRLRSSPNLFPPRNAFGLSRTQSPTTPIDDVPEEKASTEETFTEDNLNDDGFDYEDDDDDDEELLDDEDGEDLDRNRRSYNNITLRFANIPGARSRVKRKADNLSQENTNFRNRLGRLKKKKPSTPNAEESAEVTTTTNQPHPKTPRPIHSARPNNKHQVIQNSVIAPTRPIRPTRFTTEGRSKFTLRDKDSVPATVPTTQKSNKNRSNFRRPQPYNDASTVTRQSSSGNDKRRPKNNYSNRNNDASSHTQNSRNSLSARSNSANGRSRSSTSRDFSSRNRARSQINNANNIGDEFLTPDNDGTITVTHVLPVGTTIPIINGKITEYKEIVTAKTSTEVLGPLQYTTVSNALAGQAQLILTRQDTTINNAGVTEITQYVLHETPTTTVTFTPTTIRGRKTSFSHILPSTVYSVERLTSTIQPQILSNAPLANILLSQLLLGNVGLPGGVNPLLGALGGAAAFTPTINPISSMPATPVTEYRTHASTYVTTVYEGQSTVLPVTFQGKKILTTVYDTTAQTITATEFITDTIITTPTVTVPQPAAPVQPVVNSLLLQQLLLQQHLQNQQTQFDYPGNVLKSILDMTTSASQQLHLNGDNLQDLDGLNHDLKADEVAIDNSPVDADDTVLTSQTQNHKVGRKKSRKSNKGNKRKQQITPTTTEGSSIITLYVSGRRPGEFSTILSTVPIRSENTIYKRHAPDFLATSQHSNTLDNNNELLLDHHSDDDFSMNSNMQPTPVLQLKLSNGTKQKLTATQNNLPTTITTIPITSGKLHLNTVI